MFKPGALTPRDAKRLTDMAAGYDEMRRRLDAVVPPLDDRPWMKLTGEDSGDYAWTEQFFDATAGFVDRPGGRSGIVNGVGGETQTYWPAREMNGTTLSSFPHYVRAERSVITDEGVVFYFSAASGSGSVGTPTNFTYFAGYGSSYTGPPTLTPSSATGFGPTGLFQVTAQASVLATNTSGNAGVGWTINLIGQGTPNTSLWPGRASGIGFGEVGYLSLYAVTGPGQPIFPMCKGTVTLVIYILNPNAGNPLFVFGSSPDPGTQGTITADITVLQLR